MQFQSYFGVFNDGLIDESYWLFKEAQRYKIIEYRPIGVNKRYSFVYDDKIYHNQWDLIDEITVSKTFRKTILGQIDGEEKKRSYY